jgi:hypothetical protein
LVFGELNGERDAFSSLSDDCAVAGAARLTCCAAIFTRLREHDVSDAWRRSALAAEGPAACLRVHDSATF